MIDLFVYFLKGRPDDGCAGWWPTRLFASFSLALLLSGCGMINWVGGNFDDLSGSLSPGAQALVDQAYASFDGNSLRDFHVHIVGVGTKDCGAGPNRRDAVDQRMAVNPKMLTWAHPFDRLKALVYLSASGVKNEDNVEAEYETRLVKLIKALPKHGKTHLLAFDWLYDGASRVPSKSTFYVPNQCVWRLARQYPDLFVPTISVNPNRPNAVAELNYWSAMDVRYVNWLPNAQAIDASDPAFDPFYRAMIRNNMILLAHVGEESAVEAEAHQAFGNPLCFRRPLDMGLKIIMAHSGTLGRNNRLDTAAAEPRPTNLSLFIEMMETAKYKGRLFGEISAVVLHNRFEQDGEEEPALVRLMTWLNAPSADHVARFVNGSDYPLPAVNVAIRLQSFVAHGLISVAEMKPLQEIYDRNPLAFDFVLKRTLRLNRSADGPRGLPARMFTTAKRLEDPYGQDIIDQLDNPAARAAYTMTRCVP